jgi:hypothetical protein
MPMNAEGAVKVIWLQGYLPHGNLPSINHHDKATGYD